ncbi:hypothetical protein BBJ28_00021911 [Nothophytophthora sp. Chile5]|nr:hypothetical protein BBJ28_00021911 [Nothophytophthora sp. Chile5]
MMKLSKVLVVALAALCVGAWTPGGHSEALADTDVPADGAWTRSLRQESDEAAAFAAKPALTGAKPDLHDNGNPLKRRDQAQVPAHRVYDPVSGMACSLVGACVACPASEKDELFCRETGFRQELDCPKPKDPKADPLLVKPEDMRETRFKACTVEDTSSPGMAVVKFEVRGVAMALLLAASVVLLRRERGKHMSSFDLRKDPRQRTGLLGGMATSSDKASD